MYKKIRFLSFLFLLKSSLVFCQIVSVNDIIKDEAPFEIGLEINKLSDTEYYLEVALELGSGNYVVSPFSKDETYGHFEVIITENNYLLEEDKLLEIPESVEEYDPVLKSKVRFVRENIIYKRKVKLNTQSEFAVLGLVEFVLEPSCIPYDVEFLLKYKDDELTVEKMKTSISQEYKR